jgi:hypothetical protein
MESIEILGLGPTVAIVDDMPTEINSLEEALTHRNVGHQFFKVDIASPEFPSKPISTVQLVFLDLHYNNLFGANFDPYLCCDWLKSIIPEKHRYALIVWSKDKDLTEELVEVMKITETPMPFFVDTKQKDKYRTDLHKYNIDKLLAELNISVEETVEQTIEEYFGRIVEVEDGSVLINCLLSEKPPTFEVRRFDRKPFAGYIEPVKGMFLQIRVSTKPGVKTFEFSEEPNNRSELFKQDDDFEDIGDLSFLKD